MSAWSRESVVRGDGFESTRDMTNSAFGRNGNVGSSMSVSAGLRGSVERGDGFESTRDMTNSAFGGNDNVRSGMYCVCKV